MGSALTGTACDAGEDSCSCPGDCGPPPAVEQVCGDGLDDDCDGLIDGDDPDCPGGCALLPAGDPCTDGADCCSGNCKGKPGNKTCK